MVAHNWKGYAIEVLSSSLLSSSGAKRWRTKVVVRRVLGATAEDEAIELSPPRTWSAYEKANEGGLAMAKDWIDQQESRRRG